MTPVMETVQLSKEYRRGAETVHALRDVSISIDRGEFVAITGRSGSGKTTLMHLLGGLDRPTRGTVRIDGADIFAGTDRDLTLLRRRKIGFVFQQFYLLPGLTVAENITLPLTFSGERVSEDRLREVLEATGLGHRRKHLPRELSGGEMQRVAIGRALIGQPQMVLADEPTANLDSENSEGVFVLLRSLQERGFTVVLVTHNPELASRAGRIIRLADGAVLP